MRRTLHCGMMKPEKINSKKSARVATAIEPSIVWETEAKKRNMEADDTCTTKYIRNWRKNLKGNT